MMSLWYFNCRYPLLRVLARLNLHELEHELRVFLFVAIHLKEMEHEALRKDEARQKRFEKFYKLRKSPIFRLPGLSFLTFHHKKIKFRFVPHQVSERVFVSKKSKFYCSLKHGEWGEWLIKRDSFPISVKGIVYHEFHKKEDFAFYDDNVEEAVIMLYQYLCRWTKEESTYRIDRWKVRKWEWLRTIL